jgi:hypothetical protein
LAEDYDSGFGRARERSLVAFLKKYHQKHAQPNQSFDQEKKETADAEAFEPKFGLGRCCAGHKLRF